VREAKGSQNKKDEEVDQRGEEMSATRGVNVSRIASTRVVLLALSTTILLLCVAIPAYAASPWWGLTSSVVPTNLNGDLGKDEVQRLTVSATKGDYLFIEPTGVGIIPFGTTAGEWQQRLEHIYPSRRVLVGEESSGEEDTKIFNIVFPGQAGVLPLEVLPESKEIAELLGEGEPLEGGKDEAGVAIVAEGAPTHNQVVAIAENLGDAEVDGASVPVTIADKIPPGMVATSVEGFTNQSTAVTLQCSLTPVSCSFAGSLAPYETLEIVVSVKPEGAVSGEDNEATVTGGGASSVSVKQPVTMSAEPVPFGVESYGLVPENEGGSSDTQAGSHPFQLTSTLALNQTANASTPPAPVRDLRFDLPVGLIGNPTVLPQCTDLEFDTAIAGGGGGNECPRDTVVGVASTTIVLKGSGEGVKAGVSTFPVPVFNLTPEVGEPARFGYEVEGNPVILDTSVRTGDDYGVRVSVNNITESVNFISSRVTFWGVPGDASHDASRGWECVAGGRDRTEHSPPCDPLGQAHPPTFLTLPTSCAGPLQTTVQADSWTQPHDLLMFSPSEPLQSLDGCNRLQFGPEIKVAPDVQEASKPSGLTVDVHVPQEGQLNPTGLAQSNIKDIAVTLPEGLSVNPGGADGLEACSEAQIGFTGFKELNPTHEPGNKTTQFTSQMESPFCPNASKIGTAKIKLPILPNALEGSVYLATQNGNPFGSLLATYIVVEDPVSGVLLKLPGEVSLNQVTGQITSTFLNDPQGPLEDGEFHFFGGDRAPFSTPPHCGTYTTDATFTPWSGNAPVKSQSSFEITSGPNHNPCPGGALPFSPELTAGTTNIQAGSFSPFTMTMSREDGNQNLKSIQLHMPPGLSGVLTGVPLCNEAQANAGTCPASSLIGETTVSVGLGGNPYTVKGGQVFLTERYKGAPFGLSIVNPAKAGPFDLGKVVVRAMLEVDPHTAAVTVTSDDSGPYAIPPSIDGIPLEIKHVNVTINRAGGFTFNPTNCGHQAITGTLNSVEGATQTLAVPFQVTNCAVLKFAPKFAVSASGKTSKANGASLHVKLSYPKAPFGSQANIAKVKVDLPKQLPSRLTTLQKACTAAQFDANPAGCPSASIVGHAKAITPLIPVPLEGPAYFVSHGGEAFPSLIMVLQGYGVKLELVGATFISKAGITSSTFKTVPDAPVGSFELTLPQGKFSALTANGNLCKSKLAMPTAFTAQNGAVIHQTTKIAVTGCPKKKAKKASAHHGKGRAKKKR
jgi:hypothetical protein